MTQREFKPRERKNKRERGKKERKKTHRRDVYVSSCKEGRKKNKKTNEKERKKIDRPTTQWQSRADRLRFLFYSHCTFSTIQFRELQYNHLF